MAAAKNVGNAYGHNVHYEDGGAGWNDATNDITEAGALVRDIAYGSNIVASHLVHFYQLVALDYIDPLAAGLDKAPVCPRFGPAYNPGTLPYDYYYRIPTAMAGSGAAGTYNLNVYLVAQYVIALKIRRICNQIGAIWSGRAPFIQGLTPGGISTSVSQEAINKTRSLLNQVLTFIGQPADFAAWLGAGADPANLPIIGDVSPGSYGGTMLFDVVAAAMFYPEFFWYGNAHERFLAYGVFERGDPTNTVTNDERLLGRGRKITGRKYSDPYSPQSGPYVANPMKVKESIKSSWYKYTTGADSWLHPWDGETTPKPQKATAYSWVKSPRYKDPSDPVFGSVKFVPYEVGPLARMQVNGDYYAGLLYDAGYHTIPVGPFAGAKVPEYGDYGPNLKAAFGFGPNLSNSGANALSVQYIGDSALDRVAARQLEAWKIANAMVTWLDRLEGVSGWSPSLIGKETSKTKPNPVNAQGYGWTEAPRGALGHWIKIVNGKIKNYQCVVPSTWNASPVDAKGTHGPAEKAMKDLYIADARYPLELLRVSHSWDFCTACAVHLVKRDDKGEVEEEHTIKIEPISPGM
jgi:hydrogenase large subunit